MGVAIVTGAGRGIGAAIAAGLAADGHAVAIADIDQTTAEETASTISATGACAMGFRLDVTDDVAVSATVSEIAEKLGPPTILVNNAGITRDDLLFRMPLENWDAVIGVHLRGAFLMTQSVQGFMVEAGWGRIVTMSSIAADGNRGQVNYSAAKAGLEGFTRSLAIELGRFGITANAVAPGWIDSDMTRATAERVGVPFEEYVNMMVESIPMGRFGETADVAALVSFLVGEQASFISGEVIRVSGGQ